MQKRNLTLAILAVQLMLVAPQALAIYPEKRISIVVPFASRDDTTAAVRILATAMSSQLGRPVIVQNRPGAGGTIGAAYVAKAPNDGYTLYFGTSATLGFAKLVSRDLPYDPMTDFTPVAIMGHIPAGIFVTTKSGIRNIQELVVAVRARPGTFNYSSPGVGTASHLAAELFKKRTNIEMLHVPYPSPAFNWTDLMSDEIQVSSADVSPSLPFVRDGRVRMLATTGRSRSKLFPETPALGELLANYDATAWTAIAAPRGTPPDVVATLEAAILGALADPKTREQIERLGIEVAPLGTRAFALKLPEDLVLWTDAIRASGAFDIGK